MCKLLLPCPLFLLPQKGQQSKDTDTRLRINSKTGEYKPIHGTTYYANTGITTGSVYAQEAVRFPFPPSFPSPSNIPTELRKQRYHSHKYCLKHLHPDPPQHPRLRSLPLALLPPPKHRRHGLWRSTRRQPRPHKNTLGFTKNFFSSGKQRD
jgi:hypothetical protein